VRGIRNAEASLGDGRKEPRPSELAVAAVARRSLAYREAVAAGTVLERRHLIALRPGTGIPTTQLETVLGRRLTRAVDRGNLVEITDLEV
jgi:N,N'-diacetyllegionaminate synthase